MVFARFCKNVIKTSSRSYTGANYQKCVSRGTFIDFQHVWKELLCFSFVGQIQLHLITSHSANSFFNSPLHMTSVVHVTQVNMNVNIPTPPQPSDVTSVVHVTQVNMNVNIPTPPQPSDVTSVVHVTQVNMNVNMLTPPLTQVNMNVNIPTHPNPVTWRQLCMWRKLTCTLTSPPQPSDETSVVHAS